MRSGGFFRPRLAFAAGPRPTVSDKADRFRQVMLPHMNAAYTLARYLTRDPATAEDIVQEAYLRAYRSFESWRGEASKAWLLTIVRNCFLTSARAGPPHALMQTIDDALVASPPELIDQNTPESMLAEKSQTAMLRATIEQLPEPFRETLILRELEDMSYKDIASIAQVPIGTVMSRLARAREMLAGLMLADTARGARA